MMLKRSVVLYLDSELVKKSKELGFNLECMHLFPVEFKIRLNILADYTGVKSRRLGYIDSKKLSVVR